MLNKLSWTALFFLLFSLSTNAQTVGRRVSKLLVTNHDIIKNDALLEFVADVRIADCISYATVRAKHSKRVYDFYLDVENYYMDDENILFSVPIGNAKKYLRRLDEVDLEVSVYSVSGDMVMQKFGKLKAVELKNNFAIELK